jgi:hypothetical protein
MMVNLDVITCMQKFEDPIQVAFELDLIIKKGFEFEYELEQLGVVMEVASTLFQVHELLVLPQHILQKTS